MPKENLEWFTPRKPTSAPLPEALKAEVTTRANELIETVLKPRYVQPPPENPRFNYIVDIYEKWYHKAFYFNAKYKVAHPDPPEPYFEAKFARMQYAGGKNFISHFYAIQGSGYRFTPIYPWMNVLRKSAIVLTSAFDDLNTFLDTSPLRKTGNSSFRQPTCSTYLSIRE